MSRIVVQSNARYRSAAKNSQCDGCGKRIAQHKDGWLLTKIVVVEDQIDILRRNDTIRFYHPGCEPQA